MAVVIMTATVGKAAKIDEPYRGKLLRYETVSTRNEVFLQSEFVGLMNGNLAFKVLRADRREIVEKPIYEKIMVIRNSDSDHAPGVMRTVANEYMEGKPTPRIEIIELGPLAEAGIIYLDVTTATDKNGMFTDDRQLVLSAFDDLQLSVFRFTITSYKHGINNIEVSRTELYEKFGIDFKVRDASHPDNLVAKGHWDRDIYRPGDRAVLTVSLLNRSQTGSIYRLLGRSISRWPWLDGKMLYCGDLAPGKTKTIVRIFKVPAVTEFRDSYMRIGFNDISGAKPQLPLRISVHNLFSSEK